MTVGAVTLAPGRLQTVVEEGGAEGDAVHVAFSPTRPAASTPTSPSAPRWRRKPAGKQRTGKPRIPAHWFRFHRHAGRSRRLAPAIASTLPQRPRSHRPAPRRSRHRLLSALPPRTRSLYPAVYLGGCWSGVKPEREPEQPGQALARTGGFSAKPRRDLRQSNSPASPRYIATVRDRQTPDLPVPRRHHRPGQQAGVHRPG